MIRIDLSLFMKKDISRPLRKAPRITTSPPTNWEITNKQQHQSDRTPHTDLGGGMGFLESDLLEDAGGKLFPDVIKTIKNRKNSDDQEQLVVEPKLQVKAEIVTRVMLKISATAEVVIKVWP